MKDSNKTRRRIVAFVASRGGRVSSGQNDNFYRWLWNHVARGDYAHERVTALRDILLAMGEDGDAVLEYAENGRIMAVKLPDDVDLQVDDEDHDLFESTDSVWLLVAQLLAQVARLRQEVTDTHQAFDALAGDSDESQLRAAEQRVAELEIELAARSVCSHQEALATAREESDRLLASTKAALQQRLDDVQAEFREFRSKAQRRYAKDGATIRDLRAEIAELQLVKQWRDSLPVEVAAEIDRAVRRGGSLIIAV